MPTQSCSGYALYAPARYGSFSPVAGAPSRRRRRESNDSSAKPLIFLMQNRESVSRFRTTFNHRAKSRPAYRMPWSRKWRLSERKMRAAERPLPERAISVPDSIPARRTSSGSPYARRTNSRKASGDMRYAAGRPWRRISTGPLPMLFKSAPKLVFARLADILCMSFSDLSPGPARIATAMQIPARAGACDHCGARRAALITARFPEMNGRRHG